MSQASAFRLQDHLPTILLSLVVLAGLGLAAFYLWPKADQLRTERVIQEISLATPPPEPPPPEPEKVIEKPEEVEPIEQPVETPVPDPVETPSDAPAEPSMEAAGLNQLADASTDSFHLSAGKGGGFFGGGGGGGTSWEAAVALHITRALQRDPGTRTSNGRVRVAIEIDPRGHFTSARLLSSTGDAELDKKISDVLARLSPMSRGRPPGVSGTMNLNINLKRADA